MNVGDTIQCTSSNQCINLMQKLAREGIETDFLFQKDGEDGLWLEVVKVESRNNGR